MSLGPKGAGGLNKPPAMHRRRSVVVGMQAVTESIKEKQARAKDERERRNVRLGPVHKHLIEIAANHLELDVNNAIEFILDGEKQMKLADQFVHKNGTRGLKFYYQDGKVLSAEEIGRIIPGVTKGSTIKKVFITDGNDEPLEGICVYFLKGNVEEELTIRNVAELVQFGVLDLTKSSGLLGALQQGLTKVYTPALKANTNVGHLSDTPQGNNTYRNFIAKCDSFVQALNGAKISAETAVKLEPNTVDMSGISTAQDCISAAANPELLTSMEELVTIWSKQIEQVLAESEQMRKEADDTGPMAELEHWRHLTAKFNSILELIKDPKCKMVINILHIAKSKVLKQWKVQDCKITDCANEAKDNMKYLYTLEKYCEPLYRYDPVGMGEGIPSLINTIRMIHSISRYYNTSERMSSLFSKVTNQMVNACKSYITDDGMVKIWDQAHPILSKKIQDCIRLYDIYQDAFQKTKRKIEETPGEKPFEFSEMYIFGKFDAFCKRLRKIVELVTTIREFSNLQECNIEGIDPIVAKFQHILSTLKKKPYDVLDHRKLDFNHDFEDFKRQINDLQGALGKFMDKSVSKFQLTIQAIQHIERFETLDMSCLGIQDRYKSLLMSFGGEIESTRKLYMQHRDDPPIPRDMPPVAGKISWSRQLARKIQDPMERFAKHPEILKSPEAKKVIRMYNRVAQVLMEFEVLYHRAWVKSVDAVYEALQVPILVRHPESRELLCNFDLHIYLVIRETECMRKLGLDVPEIANIISHSQDKLKKNHESLKLLLSEEAAIRAKIPSVFLPLMTPSLKKVDTVIRPGLVSLTWTSMNIQSYFADIKAALTTLDHLIKKVLDIKATRVDDVLQNISSTMLCELPVKDPWTLDEFMAKNKMHTKACALEMDAMSRKVEDAVKELIGIFKENSGILCKEDEHPDTEDVGIKISIPGIPAIPVPSKETSGSRPPTSNISEDELWLQEECDELFNQFNHKCLDSILRATKLSLDIIRKRVFIQASHMGRSKPGAEEVVNAGFFKVSVNLAIPNIVIQPSLDDIQQALNKCTQCLLEVSRGIGQWGQERFRLPTLSEREMAHPSHHTVIHHDQHGVEPVLIPPQQIKNYFKSIADHKDIAKIVMMLSSAVNSFRADIGKALETYSCYHFLWDNDRDEEIKNFLETDPILAEFKAEILKFQDLDT